MLVSLRAVARRSLEPWKFQSSRCHPVGSGAGQGNAGTGRWGNGAGLSGIQSGDTGRHHGPSSAVIMVNDEHLGRSSNAPRKPERT